AQQGVAALTGGGCDVRAGGADAGTLRWVDGRTASVRVAWAVHVLPFPGFDGLTPKVGRQRRFSQRVPVPNAPPPAPAASRAAPAAHCPATRNAPPGPAAMASFSP